MEGAAGLAHEIDRIARVFGPVTPQARDRRFGMGIIGGIVHVAVHVYIAERYPDIAGRDVCHLFHVVSRG